MLMDSPYQIVSGSPLSESVCDKYFIHLRMAAYIALFVRCFREAKMPGGAGMHRRVATFLVKEGFREPGDLAYAALESSDGWVALPQEARLFLRVVVSSSTKKY